jgi:hypothetical protein
MADGDHRMDVDSHHVRAGNFDNYDVLLIVFFAAIFLYASRRMELN